MTSNVLLGVAPSIEMIVWVAIGGRESILGSILGMVLGNLIADGVSSRFPESWPLMLGALFIIVGMALPKGLAGIMQQLWPAKPADTTSKDTTMPLTPEVQDAR